MLTVCHLDDASLGCYSTGGELEAIDLVTLRYPTNALANNVFSDRSTLWFIRNSGMAPLDSV
jgi:hypothetical protein